ncbi:phosphodiesterase [Trichoderma ceciliae]
MDILACHVIYVNRSVGEARLLRAVPDDPAASPTGAAPDWRRDRVRELVQPLLDAFGDVHVCATGAACMAKLMQLHEAGSMIDMTPTMVLLDTPHDEWMPESYSLQNFSSPDPNLVNRDAEIHTPDENLYGLALLQRLITEAHLRSISKLVVPIPIISYPNTREQMTDGTAEPFSTSAGTLAASRKLIRRCLDLGAVDVIISPLGPKCIATLEICAYKAHRDAARDQQAMMEITKGRKRSWVGINDQKPFAYLREAMVAGLMKGICRLSADDDHIAGAHIAVSSERQGVIAEAVGRWHFDAHDFSDDELLVAALQMFKHALTSPELERWRIPADQLISFLVACRAAYNSFVPYHNFRHVVDVLQATFNFLVHIGSFPPYPTWSQPRGKVPKSPIAALVSPYEALTLLITAIGHDVGHPGVNNGFLTTLNAPLAQLYNDRSVLESFHCAAFSQILRRYWPAVFEDRKMRGLMISSILATDMGLHFDYMKKLGTLKESFQADSSIDSWNGRQIEDAKVLACSLLIKCADISNVARRHKTALKWMHMLSEEFSRQASMEDELEIKSSLMAPPKKDILSLSNAQLGFMNMFAIPLFQGVAEIMPAMEYTVKELHINKKFFQDKVQEEQSRGSQTREGRFSPRTRGFAVENDGEMKNMEISPAPSPSTAKSGHDPHTPVEHQDVNGLPFEDAVRDLAGDPFSCHRPDDAMEGKLVSSKHRTSETTEGSLSAGYPADWASQAASTATGKMTLSPSTQGTSIVSNESGERTLSVPAFNMSPLSLKGSPTSPRRDRDRDRETPQGDEDSSPFGGSIGRAEGKALKKRPSRFRMKDFPFFKRSKGSSPPFPTADTSG